MLAVSSWFYLYAGHCHFTCTTVSSAHWCSEKSTSAVYFKGVAVRFSDHRCPLRPLRTTTHILCTYHCLTSKDCKVIKIIVTSVIFTVKADIYIPQLRCYEIINFLETITIEMRMYRQHNTVCQYTAHILMILWADLSERLWLAGFI